MVVGVEREEEKVTKGVKEWSGVLSYRLTFLAFETSICLHLRFKFW